MAIDIYDCFPGHILAMKYLYNFDCYVHQQFFCLLYRGIFSSAFEHIKSAGKRSPF